MAITSLEIIGIILVLIVASPDLLKGSSFSPLLKFPSDSAVWLNVIVGAFLAFYAFIGFEDLVNMAEEVKNPRSTLPKALFISLGIATLLYILIALAVVSAVPLKDLSASDAPFALLFAAKGFSPKLISGISLIAIVNGVLVQIIMASRVIYGMAKEKLNVSIFAQVNPSTQTPLLATFVVMFSIIFFALFIPLVTLAQITSFIILLVFSLINLSLVVLKIERKFSKAKISFPLAIPILGLLLSLGFLGVRVYTLF